MTALISADSVIIIIIIIIIRQFCYTHVTEMNESDACRQVTRKDKRRVEFQAKRGKRFGSLNS
jgi:hypothetical protein